MHVLRHNSRHVYVFDARSLSNCMRRHGQSRPSHHSKHTDSNAASPAPAEMPVNLGDALSYREDDETNKQAGEMEHNHLARMRFVRYDVMRRILGKLVFTCCHACMQLSAQHRIPSWLAGSRSCLTKRCSVWQVRKRCAMQPHLICQALLHCWHAYGAAAQYSGCFTCCSICRGSRSTGRPWRAGICYDHAKAVCTRGPGRKGRRAVLAGDGE